MEDKLVVIHQPDFMPYIGFFERLVKADLYVILDNVQYVRRNREQWTNRDKIKTKNGVKWLTVNVRRASNVTKINEIYLAEEHGWRKKCKNVLTINYSKAKYFKEINPYIEKIFDYPCERLVEFNVNALYQIIALLGIKIETVLASDLECGGGVHGSELVVDIMKEVGQKRYLSGTGARDYHDDQVFRNDGIEVIWQQFEHPVYPQLYGTFEPYLSIIDLLYNCGIDQSRKIVSSDNE